MDDGNALRLRPLWFFHQPAQVVGITGQQYDRALPLKRRGRHHGVDGAALTRKASRSQELASMAAELRAHRHDGDQGQRPVHSRVAGAASQHFGQGHRTRRGCQP